MENSSTLLSTGTVSSRAVLLWARSSSARSPCGMNSNTIIGLTFSSRKKSKYSQYQRGKIYKHTLFAVPCTSYVIKLNSFGLKIITLYLEKNYMFRYTKAWPDVLRFHFLIRCSKMNTAYKCLIISLFCGWQLKFVYRCHIWHLQLVNKECYTYEHRIILFTLITKIWNDLLKQLFHHMNIIESVCSNSRIEQRTDQYSFDIFFSR